MSDAAKLTGSVILKDQSGWCKLWHPRGVQCTLPLPADALTAFAAVTNALEVGWLVREPGLEEGEESEIIGGVLRGEFERDGQVTPYLLLYSYNDALKWSFLKVYLNTPADVAAFESASRLKLDAMPIYIGQDKPQRGVSRQVDKFIIHPPAPFSVVYKKNPRHDPNAEEGKMKPARLFVRWAGQSASQPQAEKPPPHPVDEMKAAISAATTIDSLRDAWGRIQSDRRLAGDRFGEVERLKDAKKALLSATKPAATGNEDIPY